MAKKQRKKLADQAGPGGRVYHDMDALKAEVTREPEKQQDDKTESPNTGKTVKQDSSKPSQSEGGAEKVKATYYMEASTEAELERAWLELRRRTGRKVSKSEIVESAIRRAVQDLDARGTDSELMGDVQ